MRTEYDDRLLPIIFEAVVCTLIIYITPTCLTENMAQGNYRDAFCLWQANPSPLRGVNISGSAYYIDYEGTLLLTACIP